MNSAAAAILLLLIFLNCGMLCLSQRRLVVKMTQVPAAKETGAVCLDGSLPAYHLHRGTGDGVDNWLLQFEGGGWCSDLKSCVERAKERRGSTDLMNKMAIFSGILSNNETLNPDFYNWNRVKLRYCDGGSFSGDAELKTGNTVLHFKGQKIWEAIIQDLLPKGLGKAKKALLSGCSAGGLSAFLHCDSFAEALPETAGVKCLSDAGFFLDAQDVSSNYRMRLLYENLVTLQGMEKNLNKNCTSSEKNPKLCIFPQYALKYIKPPFFILNTAYDTFQFNHVLVPPSSDKTRSWKKCQQNPADCTEAQIAKLQDFRNEMVKALEFYQNSTQGGMYINSCFAHCQSESQDTWLADDSPLVNDKTIAKAVGDWYFERNKTVEIDCPYPCDKTCHNLIPATPGTPGAPKKEEL